MSVQGFAGQLTSIDVALFEHPSEARILTVSLHGNIAGTPGKTVLASNTFNHAFTTGSGFYNFDFSAYNVFVNAGQMLSLSMIGGLRSFFSVPADTTPAYAGGSDHFRNTGRGTWTANGADLIFRTYVDPQAVAATPLPALPLFGTGFGIMGFVGWWRKKRASEAVA